MKHDPLEVFAMCCIGAIGLAFALAGPFMGLQILLK